MSLSTGKISNSILWVCMMVTVIVLAVFYFSGSVDPDAETVEPKQTSILLFWTYLIVISAIVVTLVFSVVRFFKKWKEDPGQAWRSLIVLFVLSILFLVTFWLGDGTPLNISGYDGHENTLVWLKLTDMWLYSIYVLLGLTFLSVFIGIIWSYLKKR